MATVFSSVELDLSSASQLVSAKNTMDSLAFVAATMPMSGLGAISGTSVCGRRFGGYQESATNPRQTSHFNVVRMAAGGRKFLVGGNWKCNLTKSSIKELCAAFNDAGPVDNDSVEVVVAPPAVYLQMTREELRSDFATGAQNCWIDKGGAFTGETSAEMIKDCDADWVILGHSERRHTPSLKELDDIIATKAAYAVKTGLKVIYCIGELLEEREAGTTMNVCVGQLKALASKLQGSDWDSVVIAYEPVWAIGTGKVATPQQAEEVHLEVRKWLASNVDPSLAENMRILYGGSVSAGNCKDLAKLPDIDGFLVGGCSLKKEFLEIIDSHKIAAAAV